jgi:Domain of unknown function (DUF222)
MPTAPDVAHVADLVTRLGRADPAGVPDDDDLLDAAVDYERLIGWAQAGQARVLAEFARRPEVGGPGGWQDRGARAELGSVVRQHADDEIAAALRISRRTAAARLDTAVALARALPETAAALAGGQLDWPRAQAMVMETTDMAPPDRATVEQCVLARGPRATPTAFREAVRRAVLRVDSAAALARRERARADRFVRIAPADFDTAWVDAHLPAETAVAIDTVLTAAARQLARSRSEKDRRSIDQLRADAFAAPFLKALRTGVLDGLDPVALGRVGAERLAVQVIVRPQALADATTRPADGGSDLGELVGHGVISPALTRDLVQGATVVRLGPQPPTTSDTYRPGSDLARWVRARDATCRFPGCACRASICDLDHTIPWPEGQTSHENLAPLCRRHHQVKQTKGFRVQQRSPGVFRWTFPTGRTYDVGPDDAEHERR